MTCYIGNMRNNDIGRSCNSPSTSITYCPIWRHDMETFSMLLVLCDGNRPVNCGLSSQGPVSRNFDIFFDVHLSKQLSNHSGPRLFVTPSWLLWRHNNTLCFTSHIVWTAQTLRPTIFEHLAHTICCHICFFFYKIMKPTKEHILCGVFWRCVSWILDKELVIFLPFNLLY